MSGDVADPAPPPDHHDAEPRLFDPPPPGRRWSPGDGLRLIAGLFFLLLGLALATVAEGTISGAEEDISRAFSRLPDRIEESLLGAAQLIAALVPLALFWVIAWRRQWHLLLNVAVAAVVSALATFGVERLLGDRHSLAVIADQTISNAWFTDPDFPTTTYLAAAAGLVTASGPWLTRRWNRASWAWVTVLMLLRVLSSGQPVLGVVLAVSVGVVVGSLVLFFLGSPNPEPRPKELLEGLRAAGIEPTVIERAPSNGDQPHFIVRRQDQPTLFVKVRTPDDWDSDLLNRLYRSIRFRSSEVERPYSTLKRRVEHETLLAREAHVAGARAPRPEAIGTTRGGSVFIALDYIEGSPMSEIRAEDITDGLIADLWEQVGALHRARIAHHDTTLDNVLVDESGETTWLLDLADAELAAPPRLISRDVADLLVDLALFVGPERAVRSAVAAIGPDAVAASLPQLQPLALSRQVRSRLKADKSVLDDVRGEVITRTGTDEVPPERLERISARGLVMIGAGTLAFYSLLPQLANFGDTVDSFTDAELVWVPAIVLAAASTFVFATVSFLGSVAQPVPLAPSARLSLASAFAALVGPASTGRMTLAVGFLRRVGVDTASASASVGLNSAAGVVTHLLLMFSFFAWTGSAGVGGFSLPDANTVMMIGAVIAAIVAIAMVLGPIRRRVLGPLVDAARRAGSYLGEVFRSPVRVLALLGGSSFITLSYVAALIFSVEAFGGGLSAPQIGSAYLGAAAIANLAPTPGGLGALEAAMIAALTGFGLGDSQAVSAVLTFRLATFWLPILPGWFTFVWMQRNEEI